MTVHRFSLKFLWLDKTIAFSLDQRVGNRFVPLTDFYFWPQTDAWEGMKEFLEGEDFINQEESIFILNQITEVINLWQDKDLNYAKNFSVISKKFPLVSFLNSSQIGFEPTQNNLEG